MVFLKQKEIQLNLHHRFTLTGKQTFLDLFETFFPTTIIYLFIIFIFKYYSFEEKEIQNEKFFQTITPIFVIILFIQFQNLVVEETLEVLSGLGVQIIRKKNNGSEKKNFIHVTLHI